MQKANTYFCPSFTKPFKEDPLLVAIAFPPRPTMRAVSTALFPPKDTGVEEITFIKERDKRKGQFLQFEVKRFLNENVNQPNPENIILQL